MEKSSQGRSMNWLPQEISRLKELVLEYRTQLEASQKNKDTEKRKHKLWKLITNEVNALSSNAVRGVEEVRKKWSNLKAFAKKQNADRKKAVYKTGGGPPPSNVDKVTEDIMEAYGSSASFNGICGGIDTSDLFEVVANSRNEHIQRTVENMCDQNLVCVDDSVAGSENNEDNATVPKLVLKRQKVFEVKNSVSRAPTSGNKTLVEIENFRLIMEQEKLALKKEVHALKVEKLKLEILGMKRQLEM